MKMSYFLQFLLELNHNLLFVSRSATRAAAACLGVTVTSCRVLCSTGCVDSCRLSVPTVRQTRGQDTRHWWKILCLIDTTDVRKSESPVCPEPAWQVRPQRHIRTHTVWGADASKGFNLFVISQWYETYAHNKIHTHRICIHRTLTYRKRGHFWFCVLCYYLFIPPIILFVFIVLVLNLKICNLSVVSFIVDLLPQIYLCK